MEKQTFTIDEENNGRKIHRFLASLGFRYPITSQLLRKKQIYINGISAKSPNTLLKKGDTIEVQAVLPKTTQKEFQLDNKHLENFKKMIVFEDEHVVVINKPAGIAVQRGTKVQLSIDEMALLYNAKCKIVHRLDRQTSGLLVIAKSLKTAQLLTLKFRQHEVAKTYYALVDNINAQLQKGNQGTIKLHMMKDAKLQRMRIAGNEGMYSETKYKILDCAKSSSYSCGSDSCDYSSSGSSYDIALVQLHPKTGRTHQLRLHCADHLNAVIIGDLKYSRKTIQHSASLGRSSLHLNDMKLQAVCIEFKLFERSYNISLPQNQRISIS